MKYMLCFLVLTVWSCQDVSKKEQTQNTNRNIEQVEDSLAVYNFEGLKPFLNKMDDTIYVVNFWATWCAPCIKELPAFEKLGNDYKSENVNVLLVSLDFPHQYETKLKPFISKHNLQSDILVLNDVDANSWIPHVSAEWSGAIPATLIYNKDKRAFYEQTFTYKELQTELNKFLK
ncbi:MULTISPECIES: redoxin domain-containing protein [Bizionia]|uniref:Redoxin domain-containing protein n=1 Tax=Bizionia algoritergicola TaxID=291187 RepID=A0A5D0QUD3_9FLAO|nr:MULTISPECIES: redoxin domain-containing protein [Bizionia]OBX22892.1 thioredoxin [Bizionia sp. APA-3]TYB72797.1 redoxin domain-containing protein [Bizionia algoritergicola]